MLSLVLAAALGSIPDAPTLPVDLLNVRELKSEEHRLTRLPNVFAPGVLLGGGAVLLALGLPTFFGINEFAFLNSPDAVRVAIVMVKYVGLVGASLGGAAAAVGLGLVLFQGIRRILATMRRDAVRQRLADVAAGRLVEAGPRESDEELARFDARLDGLRQERIGVAGAWIMQVLGDGLVAVGVASLVQWPQGAPFVPVVAIVAGGIGIAVSLIWIIAGLPFRESWDRQIEQLIEQEPPHGRLVPATPPPAASARPAMGISYAWAF